MEQGDGLLGWSSMPRCGLSRGSARSRGDWLPGTVGQVGESGGDGRNLGNLRIGLGGGWWGLGGGDDSLEVWLAGGGTGGG